jgi:L-iditol 2-dehydrogenase
MREKTAVLEKEASPPRPDSAMQAAVYRGRNRITLETLPVPEISSDEILVRVRACGICGTDLKKIEYGLADPPRIFGHEIAGTVVRTGDKVDKFRVGDRVAVHHHVPCGSCFYCRRRLFSQCAHYRRTGTTAGFEPAGGGFAEYVRVMNWIVAEGTVRIPEDASFEEASFLEPLNTCLRALETAGLAAGEVVAVTGQGPVGLLLTQAAACDGAAVVGLGACAAFNPFRDDVERELRKLTDGRGPDLVIVANADPRAVGDAMRWVRRGGRVMLFAQTVPGETIPVDVSSICMEEKRLIGSYSSSIDLQDKAARLIFGRKVEVERLISHRLPLAELPQGIRLASNPTENSLKVIVQP